MFIVVGVVGYTTCGYSTGLPEFMMYDVFMMNVAGCGCEWAPGQLGRGTGSHG